MYSLEQLKIFVTVVETGSFSATGRKLKRAQSGISQAISNLEIAIDQTLFDRNKNTPTLTKSGKTLLPVAYSILQHQTYFDQKVESLAKNNEQDVVIAIDESISNHGILKIIAPLAQQYPITNFELISATTFDVEELIKTGKAQIGIIYSDGELKVDMDFFLLGQARFLTIASPQHALAKLNKVNSSDLKAHRQCAHRSLNQSELWFSYAISAKVWYANTHQTLIDLVTQNVGWALVPELAIKKQLKQGDLVALPVVHEQGGWLTPLGCVVSRSKPTGPVTESLLTLLQQHFLKEGDWKAKV